MNYHLEDTSDLEKELSLHIPAENVNRALDAVIEERRKHLSLDGFRRGMVPPNVVEARFGKEIAVQATEELIRTTVDDILNKEALVPVSGLQFNGNDMHCLCRNQDFDICCSFEVMPAVPLPDLSELSIEVEEILPKPEDVRRTSRLLIRRFATLEGIADQEFPVNGNIVLVDMTASSDGRIFIGGNVTRRYMQLGDGSNIPEVEAVIRSLKAGEEGSGSFLCPQDYIDPSLRGKPVEFMVKLHKVFKEKLPEFNDDLAHAMGQPSVSALRKYLYDYEFNRELKELKEQTRQKLLENVLETMDFPLPRCMVNKAVGAYLNRTGEVLAAAGLTVEEKENILLQVREEAQLHARRQVKAQCFLMAVGNRDHIQVYEKDADSAIRRMAEESGQAYETLRERLWQSGAISDLQEQLLADKALDHMYAKARKIVVDANGIPVTPPSSLPAEGSPMP